jgi:hypothetical protein
MALGSASLRGKLRCCHMSYSPPRAVDHKNKEGLAALGRQLGSHISKARSCITEVPVNMQGATVRPHSAASAQLTTPGHDYNGDTTRQDSVMGHAMFSAAER